MAWIPLLLASWIVVDALIVTALLVLARRRQRELRHPTAAVAARSASRSARGLPAVPTGRTMMPLR